MVFSRFAKQFGHQRHRPHVGPLCLHLSSWRPGAHRGTRCLGNFSSVCWANVELCKNRFMWKPMRKPWLETLRSLRKLCPMELMTSTIAPRWPRKSWQRSLRHWQTITSTWRVLFWNPTWWRMVWKVQKPRLRPLQPWLVRLCCARFLLRCQAFFSCRVRQLWMKTMRKRQPSTWAPWTVCLPASCHGICPSLMVKLCRRLALWLGWAKLRTKLRPRKPWRPAPTPTPTPASASTRPAAAPASAPTATSCKRRDRTEFKSWSSWSSPDLKTSKLYSFISAKVLILLDTKYTRICVLWATFSCTATWLQRVEVSAVFRPFTVREYTCHFEGFVDGLFQGWEHWKDLLVALLFNVDFRIFWHILLQESCFSQFWSQVSKCVEEVVALLPFWKKKSPSFEVPTFMSFGPTCYESFIFPPGWPTQAQLSRHAMAVKSSMVASFFHLFHRKIKVLPCPKVRSLGFRLKIDN